MATTLCFDFGNTRLKCGVFTGAVMTQVTPTGVDVGAEARWLAWQARGTASDRRSDRIMKRLFVIAMILLAGALIAQVL